MPSPTTLQTEWARVVIATLADAGVSEAVLSPGSRSTPYVLALASEPRIRLLDVVDERLAAFVALGTARVTGRPALLLCTSGTALAHYLPAVVEDCFTESEPSPLQAGEKSIHTVDLSVEAEQIARLKAWRATRDSAAVAAALAALRAAAQEDRNVMPASLDCARAGVTTGEWAQTLRDVFGEYRGPTGVALVIETAPDENLDAVKRDVAALSERLGRRLTFLVGKPGLDGHSNGAEQIAVRAADTGLEVIYDGIRVTPEQLVMQFLAIKHFLGKWPVHLLPLTLEELPPNTRAFDTVFSMGVLYHRRSPFDHLTDLRGALRSGGELVLETLVVEGGEQTVLVPEGRYAKMKNVWFLPSPPTLVSWLHRARFRNMCG